MAGKFALIVGNSHYDDSSLSRLKAPDVDVHALEEVLKSPDVGHFDEVTSLLNEGCASVRKAIARFYDQRRRDDLLLLYFSGHGVKDEQGHLYLALRDTETTLLAGTAIESAFITGRMDRSFSKRQVLVLDCCHSGAFAHGVKAAQGVSVGTAGAFEGIGIGRVILTATDSTQYALEGDQVIGDAQNSLFTHFVIDGLRTGAADRDNDGVVTVDELYDHVRENVLNTTPRQTPCKWTYRQQGEIILAQNPFVQGTPPLPPEIQEAMNSALSSLRLEVVRDLATLLRGHHVGRARAALAALKRLSADDSRKVRNAAIEALSEYDEKELVRPAEEAKVDIQAEVAFAPQNASDAGLDHERARALNAEIQQAVAAEAAWRHAEAPESPEDLTSWNGTANHPELETVFDRIQALSPIPSDRLARSAVEEARREFGAGRREAALARLEQFRPAHALVTRALTELRAEAERIKRRDEDGRREAAVAQRQRELAAEKARIETLLERPDLEAAERALSTAEKKFEASDEFRPLRERWATLWGQAQHERLARQAVEDARREFEAGHVQAAVASLGQFRPAHDLVTRALAELRARADRIERERAEAARRAAQAERRQRELDAERARLDELALRDEPDADEQALGPGEKTLERFAEFESDQPQASIDSNVAVDVHRRTFSWSTSRLAHVAVAIAVLVALTVAGWRVGIRLGGSNGPRDLKPPQNQVDERSTPGSAPSPPNAPTTVAEKPAAAIQTESPPPNPTPIEVGPPAPGGAPAPAEPEPSVAKPPAPSGRLEDLITRARTQMQSGQRAQALDAVVEGLQIDQKNTVLRSILDSLLRDAQLSAQRSKQAAIAVDADVRADEAFNRGLQKESEAVRLRRTGRIDGATRSFLAATDRFSAAARESRKIAEEEEAEQERIKPQQPPVGEQPRQGTSATNQPERPSFDLAAEQELAAQTLRRYEAAYGSLSVGGIRAVYPSAPIDQLQKDFAGYRTYTLKFTPEIFKFRQTPTGIAASVPGRASHDILLTSGERRRTEGSETFSLEKRGNTWIIVQIHKD